MNKENKTNYIYIHTYWESWHPDIIWGSQTWSNSQSSRLKGFAAGGAAFLRHRRGSDGKAMS